jgi:hypothetical protein
MTHPVHHTTQRSATQAVRASLRNLALTLLLASSLSFAQQGPIPGTPRPDASQQGGGGVGIGINIDVGSVINALKNLKKKDDKCDPEVEESAQRQFAKEPIIGTTAEQFVRRLCEQHASQSGPRKAPVTVGSSKKIWQRATPQGNTCKVNGNFESGNLSSWSGADNGPTWGGYTNPPVITILGINSGAYNLGTSHQTIVSAGNDPIVGALLQQVRPGGGVSAVRLGNSEVGYGAELLAKSFKVSAADAVIGFSFAAVLNDGGHGSGNPRFIVRVLDSSGTDITNNIAGGRVQIAPPAPLATPPRFSNELIFDKTNPNPFFLTYPGGYWKDWSCAEINLADLIGQDVTIEFITQDCNGGGHYSYVYIDDFCATCSGGPEGSIKLAEADKCGVGKVCVDVTVPKTGSLTGQATPSLEIWQNGIKLTTYTGNTLTADGKVCFPIDPSTISGLDSSKGFDYSGKVALQIGSFVLPTKLLGAGPDGLQPGSNNDYSSAACIPSDGCGQPGQSACANNGGGSSGVGTGIGVGIGLGGILGGGVRPPVMPRPPTVCLTGDCTPKPEQSTGQEFKEPKVACVRKVKPVQQPKPIAAPKPKPKPAVAATPPALVDPNAPPKPKPKPRPKPAAKPAAADDDCE